MTAEQLKMISSKLDKIIEMLEVPKPNVTYQIPWTGPIECQHDFSGPVVTGGRYCRKCGVLEPEAQRPSYICVFPGSDNPTNHQYI